MARKKKVEEEDEEDSKESGDEELVEAEESQEEDSDEIEFFESGLERIQEGDFEISDFSIGDIGLATANAETSWRGSLESSLADEPRNKWEEQHEEPEERGPYSGGVDERETGHYREVEHESDFYTGSGRGTDSYSSDSGNYNAKDESGEFYDPRIGKRTEVEEVRQAGKSKLEITGLQSGFGRGTEKDTRGKRDNKKYTN